MRQIPPKTAFFDIGETLGDVIVPEPDGSVLRLEVYSGVREALEELKANRVRIGVISQIGTHPPERVDRMLEEAALLDFFVPAPGSVDLRVYLSGPIRKDEAAFREALRRAGHAATPTECVFVGENATERQEAARVGMRVTDRPRLALDVLLGLQPSYLKVTVPPEHRGAAWHRVLLEHLLLPLYVTGPSGSTV